MKIKNIPRKRIIMFVCVAVVISASIIACSTNEDKSSGSLDIHPFLQDGETIINMKDVTPDLIPDGYDENTLLRTTNDFLICTFELEFKTFSKKKIDSFTADNEISFIEGNKQLKEVWSWSGQWNNPTKAGRFCNLGESNFGRFWKIEVRGETKYLNTKTFKEIKMKKDLPEMMFIDKKQGLAIGKQDSDVRSSEDISLFDMTGKKYWEFTERDASTFHLIGNYLIYSRRDLTGYFIVDITSKKPIARMRTRARGKMSSINGSPVFSDKYFWSIGSNTMRDETNLYRIDPESFEVFTYDIKNPDRVFYIDEKLYVVDETQTNLYVIDPDSGITESVYSVNELFTDTKFTIFTNSYHPFVCSDEMYIQAAIEFREENDELPPETPFTYSSYKSTNDISDYIFNPAIPENSFEIETFIAESNYNNGRWLGWKNYWSAIDGEKIYGIDTFTGEHLWWIDIDELGSYPEVLLADEHGVLIAHGNTISAYAPTE